MRKFIIIDSPSKRAVKQIFNSYKNCEFFFVREMIDIYVLKFSFLNIKY